MSQDKNRSDLSDGACAQQQDLQSKFQVLTGNLNSVVEEQNLNAEFVNRITEIALRGAQMLAARQGAALRETFDELNTVFNVAANKSNDPSSAGTHMQFFEFSLNQGLEHLRVAFELANELNLATWDAYRERMDSALQNAKLGKPITGSGV